MWFRNAAIFKLGEPLDAVRLEEALGKRPFQPCGGLDWFSEGWAPAAAHLEGMVYRARERQLVRLRREDKILPPAAIKKALAEKVAEIEAREGRRVGRKERLALKEQVTDDLLPKALMRESSIPAFIAGGWLVVDASASSKAEGLVSKLREALPPFPATLPRTRMAPHAAMTDWLAAGEAPGGFELDEDALLKDSSENGAVVRVSRIDLTSDEIRQHIATGKQVVKLGLIWNEKIRFQLTDTLQLKRIQFLDVLQDEASQAGDDRESLFEATFLLMTEELGELIHALVAALGGLEQSQTVPFTAAAAAELVEMPGA
ncbi:recombination-associated protein RdgC [Chromobacterium sp. IIBBL 290-4]|uniref:recombination-associated protein RdgC n=1 Tax=Chromobacterium sp. IIBBL 290-4 TaxID=2953890 RepID=UPI0020B6BF61|nr:recombination-associated protein RdgC [Chromobacterium sp. IIBBL 290-4]UTH73747.1 recombination-associated protein RdgC [Chromobacterium sp. IIBBL 290-4]